MSEELSSLTISRLAAAAGVHPESIRFYQRRGLLRVPTRAYGAIRRYDGTDVERVRFIKSAQRLGFSLDEVAELLRLQDGTGCDEAREIAERRLTDVRQRRADLERMEATLEDLVQACLRRENAVDCPLIDALLHSATG